MPSDDKSDQISEYDDLMMKIDHNDGGGSVYFSVLYGCNAVLASTKVQTSWNFGEMMALTLLHSGGIDSLIECTQYNSERYSI